MPPASPLHHRLPADAGPGRGACRPDAGRRSRHRLDVVSRAAVRGRDRRRRPRLRRGRQPLRRPEAAIPLVPAAAAEPRRRPRARRRAAPPSPPRRTAGRRRCAPRQVSTEDPVASDRRRARPRVRRGGRHLGRRRAGPRGRAQLRGPHPHRRHLVGLEPTGLRRRRTAPTPTAPRRAPRPSRAPTRCSSATSSRSRSGRGHRTPRCRPAWSWR